MLRINHKKYVYPPFFETVFEALLLGASAKEQKNTKTADILINPDLSGYRLLRIGKKQEKLLMEKGYQAAINELEKHLILQAEA